MFWYRSVIDDRFFVVNSRSLQFYGVELLLLRLYKLRSQHKSLSWIFFWANWKFSMASWTCWRFSTLFCSKIATKTLDTNLESHGCCQIKKGIEMWSMLFHSPRGTSPLLFRFGWITWSENHPGWILIYSGKPPGRLGKPCDCRNFWGSNSCAFHGSRDGLNLDWSGIPQSLAHLHWRTTLSLSPACNDSQSVHLDLAVWFAAHIWCHICTYNIYIYKYSMLYVYI